MSQWYEVEDIEDIDLDAEGKEIHLYLYSNDFGAVYASVSVELIEQVLKQREVNNHLAEDKK